MSDFYTDSTDNPSSMLISMEVFYFFFDWCHLSSCMLSGFACDDYWFPSPLNLTVLHERGGFQYGCNQIPDSFEFPVEI